MQKAKDNNLEHDDIIKGMPVQHKKLCKQETLSASTIL